MSKKIGEFEIKAMTKTELANAYNISVSTLLTWVLKMPKGDLKTLNYPDKNGILNPKQVEMIVQHLGEP